MGDVGVQGRLIRPGLGEQDCRIHPDVVHELAGDSPGSTMATVTPTVAATGARPSMNPSTANLAAQ
jgi:hypothetical protein